MKGSVCVLGRQMPWFFKAWIPCLHQCVFFVGFVYASFLQRLKNMREERDNLLDEWVNARKQLLEHVEEIKNNTRNTTTLMMEEEEVCCCTQILLFDSVTSLQNSCCDCCQKLRWWQHNWAAEIRLAVIAVRNFGDNNAIEHLKFLLWYLLSERPQQCIWATEILTVIVVRKAMIMQLSSWNCYCHCC